MRRASAGLELIKIISSSLNESYDKFTYQQVEILVNFCGNAS